MKKFLFILPLLLVGCGPSPDTPLVTTTPSSDARFSVSRVGVVSDELAYCGKRGVYVIVDRKTGQEYVGLSGVGISELGSHQVGKNHVSDER